uniref:Uncharacterized protein n=1 Tax=Pseudomonas aeruginosa TaxID=287 RepID=Q9KW10_PSEAI|nr:hypothetical protein [Pseudomonas aeruginosa]
MDIRPAEKLLFNMPFQYSPRMSRMSSCAQMVRIKSICSGISAPRGTGLDLHSGRRSIGTWTLQSTAESGKLARSCCRKPVGGECRFSTPSRV